MHHEVPGTALICFLYKEQLGLNMRRCVHP